MKVRYLLVDDAPFIRELIKAALTPLGHVCVGEANDAIEAVELVARTLPDVVFLDLVMPGRNGLQCAQDILDAWPSTKLIACTTLEKDDLAGREAGITFQAWLSKPFTQDGLKDAISECFPRPKELKP